MFRRPGRATCFGRGDGDPVVGVVPRRRRRSARSMPRPRNAPGESGAESTCAAELGDVRRRQSLVALRPRRFGLGALRRLRPGACPERMTTPDECRDRGHEPRLHRASMPDVGGGDALRDVRRGAVAVDALDRRGGPRDLVERYVARAIATRDHRRFECSSSAPRIPPCASAACAASDARDRDRARPRRARRRARRDSSSSSWSVRRRVRRSCPCHGLIGWMFVRVSRFPRRSASAARPAGDPGAHGAGRDAQNLADLGVIHADEVAERDRGAVFGRESCDRVLDVEPVGDDASTGWFHCRRFGRQAVVHGRRTAPARRASSSAAFVATRYVQVENFEPSVERPDPPRDREQRLLGGVARVLAIAEDPAAYAEHRSAWRSSSVSSARTVTIGGRGASSSSLSPSAVTIVRHPTIRSAVDAAYDARRSRRFR